MVGLSWYQLKTCLISRLFFFFWLFNLHKTDFIQFDLFYIYINYYDHNDITFKQINWELADDHIEDPIIKCIIRYIIYLIKILYLGSYFESYYYLC